jgi:hypothetical protein
LMKSIGLAIAVVIITASAVCRRSGAGGEPKLQERSRHRLGWRRKRKAHVSLLRVA